MATKKVFFYEDNTLKFDLKIKLDFYNPECFAYINVERFIGKNINILYIFLTRKSSPLSRAAETSIESATGSPAVAITQKSA